MISAKFNNISESNLSLIDRFLGHKYACRTIYVLDKHHWNFYKKTHEILFSSFLQDRNLTSLMSLPQNPSLGFNRTEIVSTTIHEIYLTTSSIDSSSMELLASNIEDLSLCCFYAALSHFIPLEQQVNLASFSNPKEPAVHIRKQLLSQPEWIDSITLIDLNNRRIPILPKEIGLFKNLTELYLENNLLKTLPKEIGLLKNLQEIDLKNNRITYLPKEIGELTSLKYLDLSANALEDLPIELSRLSKLIHLDVSHNSLTEIPPSIGNLDSLLKFNFSFNQITHLPDEISALVNLKNLNCSYNHLLALPDSIVNLPNLIHLNVQSNRLIFLPKFIGNFRSLQHLLICRNQIKFLPKSLGNLKDQLTRFTFLENPIIKFPLVLEGLISNLSYLSRRTTKRLRFED